MFKCVIGLYGLPHEITDKHEVEVELEDEAILTDLIAALLCKIPKLEGLVIKTSENKLTEDYAFNINGHFYIDEIDIRIHGQDNIALLALAAGG